MAPLVRPMTRADLDVAADWAAAEGWEPGVGDADAFWAADPGGFWAAEVDGRMVATLSLVRQGPAFGFVGFYIVEPASRGRGIGLALWRAVVDASPIPVLGLDGVPDQQDNYARSGFTFAYGTARYAGLPADLGDAASDPDIVDALSLPWERLVAFDAAHRPAPAPAFLEPWLCGPGRRALALVQGGTLRGYGGLRPTEHGHRVGPLLADAPDVAARLLRALAAAADGRIGIDVPLANAPAVALAEGLGLVPSFETARMYRGGDPDLPVGDIYGVTSLELG